MKTGTAGDYGNTTVKFTIFTACYNSEHLVEKVFRSLKKQTYRNFEWLVINDGSTDDTARVIRTFSDQCDFPVTFIDLNENVMLNRSRNIALDNAKGEYFIALDHDDEIVPDALETFLRYWESVPSDYIESLAGVVCNCVDQYGNAIGDRFPQSPLLSNDIELRFHLGIKGEKFGCVRTAILREYRPSTIDRYVPENAVNLLIALKYSQLYINEALRIYYIGQEHESLSNVSRIRYPVGMHYYYTLLINRIVPKIRGNYAFKLKSVINYIRMSLYAKYGLYSTITSLDKLSYRLLGWLVLPLSMVIILRDIAQGRTK